MLPPELNGNVRDAVRTSAPSNFQVMTRALGAGPRKDESPAKALDVTRSSDPFRGMVKKTASLRQGYGRQVSRVLGLAGQPF